MKHLFYSLALVGLVSACASQPTTGNAKLCSDGIEIAERELEAANARGLGSTVNYARAVSLLGAARIQLQFGKYPNCINKVERARHYISLNTE